jgi:hypothetical protein
MPRILTRSAPSMLGLFARPGRPIMGSGTLKQRRSLIGKIERIAGMSERCVVVVSPPGSFDERHGLTG